MKTLFITLAVFLISLSSYSYTLEAKSVNAMVRLIKRNSFKHQEDAMVFGFNSIQSCLYVSAQFAILKNYCVPKKDYPAKGFTIISSQYGIIDLYQEDLNSVLKRDIQITTFSRVLADYVKAPFTDSRIAELNIILEKLYNENTPACWSTNFSDSTAKPDANCTNKNILKFAQWARETQTITKNEKTWHALMDSIEAAITK